MCVEICRVAQANNITLSLKPGDPPPLARADIEGFATVLNNLVTNALSYTPAGGDFGVSTFYEGDSAIVEVADTGIGIAEEHQARIFERFYRVDKARLRQRWDWIGPFDCQTPRALVRRQRGTRKKAGQRDEVSFSVTKIHNLIRYGQLLSHISGVLTNS